MNLAKEDSDNRQLEIPKCHTGNTV